MASWEPGAPDWAPSPWLRDAPVDADRTYAALSAFLRPLRERVHRPAALPSLQGDTGNGNPARSRRGQ